MTHVTYKIVQHDGGWAYKVDGVFSEPFETHADALTAARIAAAEQRQPGHTEAISLPCRASSATVMVDACEESLSIMIMVLP